MRIQIIVLILIVGLFVVGCADNQSGQAFKAKQTDDSKLDSIQAVTEPECRPTEEICDGKDNDCDKEVDEGGVCDINERAEFNGYIVQLKDEPVAKKVGESQKSLDSYRAILESKQASVKNQVLTVSSKVKIAESYKNVFNGFAVTGISEKQARDIEALEDVKKVYPDYAVQISLMDSIPLIGADQVWDMQVNETNLTGEGVTIGMIDTGIDYTHPDLGNCTTEEFLSGSCEKVIGGYDFGDNDSDPMDALSTLGHGTHAASIAAGNGILKGVAPEAKIYAIKAYSDNISGVDSYFSIIIASVEYTVDLDGDGDFTDHLDAININFAVNCELYYGGYSDECGPDDPMSQALDNAVDLGVVVVTAAGNKGPTVQTITSPGTSRKAITVGATYKKDYQDFYINDSLCRDGYSGYGYCSCVNSSIALCNYWGDSNPLKDQVIAFSSRGPIILGTEMIIKPDILAPGAVICAARFGSVSPWDHDPRYSLCLDEQHVQLAGTSMANPMVLGAVALIKQAHPDWTPNQIKIALKNTAVDLGYDMNTQGAGRIDVLSAINYEPICGDTNGDSSVDVSDAVYLINYVFTGGNAPVCEPLTSCGDTNGDETVNISDAVYLINYIFNGGAAPDCSGTSKGGDDYSDWSYEQAMNYLSNAQQNAER